MRTWPIHSAPPSGARSLFSILWTLALVAFLAFAITDFAGLAVSPTLIVPGVQGIQSGATVNSGMDFNGNWDFNPWNAGSSSSYQSSGGNTGPFMQMTLFGSTARGYFTQPFSVDGSLPYTGSVRLDVEIIGGLTSGRLLVWVDSSNSTPDPNTAIGRFVYRGPQTWTPTGRIDVGSRLTDPGLYYLKVGFVADTATGPVDVGLDNVRLTWTTDAAVFFYVPVPLPYGVFVSQDKTLFLSYYGLITAAIFLIGAYFAVRERREIWRSFTAPIEAIGTRLRSRSAWIAVAQVWMAVTFFQIAVIYLLRLVQIEPTNPIDLTAQNAWVWLFELANAGVYEEVVFRLLLIGLPMALGSLVLRIMDVNRGATGNGPGSAGRFIAGAWRYLIGGVLRRDSPKEAQVAAWAFLFASSAIFGLAHESGWGWWKVVPSMVAGLGFGYLFLRHGIGAAILAHFVNDYALSLSYEGIGGDALAILISLVFFGLAIAGAGFLVWYAIDAWRHLTELLARFRPPTRVATMPPPGPYAAPTPQPFLVPPGPGPSQAPPAGPWSPSPPVPPSGLAFRDPGRIPREYTPSYVPPPYGYPPVRFQCPYCGWVEARYEAGRFTCTRCARAA
jgi:Type II CAAX prenyl endopeptidase Rce1-like